MNSFGQDVVCFSHLRWGFVFQRPQHLMSRCAKRGRVFFIEEPVMEGDSARLQCATCSQTGVHVVTPFFPRNTERESVPTRMRECLKDLFRQERIQDFVAWYYTPMAIEFTDELTPALTVYDCMDELSAFAHAPTGMLANENKLFQQANLVFTGGLSLYEAKCSQHPDVHLFPSSVDRAHFARAMESIDEPPDQSSVPHPRIGYAGVIDERMDLDLLAFLADSRPEWHIVLLGPVVKINVDDIPSRPNIHLLGKKPYEELPAYLSGWDVALLPFAQNDATRFISPTKTPEYLAADLPVVSTPIRDVERPYGKLGLVSIGRTHREFLEAVEQQLLDGRPAEWRTEVDSFLRALSWDKTWAEMERLICRDLDRSQRESVQEQTAPLPIAKRRVSVAHV